MSSRIADTDPDEVGDRRNRWWWTIGAVGLLCLFVAIVLIAAANGDPTPGTVADTQPNTEPPDTVATVPEVTSTVPGFPASGSDYTGQPMQVLARRTSPTGVAMVLYNYGPLGGVPGPTTGGWAPAPWCNPTSSYRLTSALGSSVSVSNGPLYAATDEVRAMLHAAGDADGTPYRVMLVQAPAGTTQVSVRFGDGATDTAPVTDGYALLATTGPFHGKFSLTLTGGGPLRVVDWSQIIVESSVRWQRACLPPPPGLPQPGPEQPADADAARNVIREQFSVLFQSGKPIDERLIALDDPTGVAAAMDEVNHGQFAEAAAKATYVLGDVVFATPTQAWFEYTLVANGSTFTGRFGEANLTGGVWKISRATICQDLALGAGTCQPVVDPVNPNPVLPPVEGDT